MNILLALLLYGMGMVSPLWPSPPEAREAMLDLAKVKSSDTVYDLGSGTGELVLAAAKRGAKALGIEIQPRLAEVSQMFLDKSGVKATILTGDFFDFDIHKATVVTLYLGDEANLKLMPKLKSELRRGTRVVSYEHGMGSWKPDKSLLLADGKYVFLWVIK